MKAYFVGSGSKGNATVFISGDTMILFDAGISCKRIHECIGAHRKSVADLQGIFITHNHTDHIKDLPYICKDNALIYSGEETIDRVDYNVIEPGVGVEIGPFTIIPFSSHHDAPNPLNFIILVEGMKIGYVTDTGTIDEMGLALLQSCHYYVFESNYEPKLLEASSRPAWLKQRIRSDWGHLSNLQCGRYLKKLIDKNTKTIFLAHLSEECNTPEHAYSSAKKHVAKSNNPDVEIICLKQYEPVEADLSL